jgi:hypothetical protein
VKHVLLEQIGQIVEKEAKSYPGHYQAGWAPLKPATIARKATGDSPLLETGEMRDSIGHRIHGHESVEIGSDNNKALWHERGTSRIPPRPFLSTALMHKTPEILKLVGDSYVALITTHKVP